MSGAPLVLGTVSGEKGLLGQCPLNTCTLMTLAITPVQCTTLWDVLGMPASLWRLLVRRELYQDGNLCLVNFK